MLKSVAAFLSGVGVSLLAAYAGRGIRRQRREQAVRVFDLNRCSMVDLRRLGLGDQTAARIYENRPYRSKLELVSRVMLPTEIYDSIKHRVRVANPREPVKVAAKRCLVKSGPAGPDFLVPEEGSAPSYLVLLLVHPLLDKRALLSYEIELDSHVLSLPAAHSAGDVDARSAWQFERDMDRLSHGKRCRRG